MVTGCNSALSGYLSEGLGSARYTPVSAKCIKSRVAAQGKAHAQSMAPNLYVFFVSEISPENDLESYITIGFV
jgi:hypothetical protein